MKEFSIDLNAEGQRIDLYLSEQFEDRSRSYIQKIIKDGYVKVNQKPVKSNYRLSFDDRVEVTLPEAKEPDIVPEDIPLDILYEDQDIIMINKPKQMVVHPAPGHYSGTLVNALMYHCGNELSAVLPRIIFVTISITASCSFAIRSPHFTILTFVHLYTNQNRS